MLLPTASKDQRRAAEALVVADRIESEERLQLRTEALSFGRAIALAGLPCKKTSAPHFTKRIRFGADCWVHVSIAATVKKQPLPFGSDRYVVAGIQHLAVEQGSPFVTFGQAGELLKMFGLPDGGHEYRLLRERLHRVAAAAVSIEVTGSEQAGPVEGVGYKLVTRYALPKRSEIGSKQLSLPGAEPHFIRLSDDWWNYLQSGSDALMMVRLDLLKNFVDRPTAWDYLCFLTHRCGAAKTESIVPHDALLALFRRGKERPRKTIERLRRIHDEIMTATGDRLQASLEVVGTAKPEGRGRPRKLWGLRVGPSNPVILSGAKSSPQLSD